jgi:MOSC domain-containing protein YiiM
MSGRERQSSAPDALGQIVATGQVAALCQAGPHSFSKTERASITLLAGLGALGDAHCGSTVQHLSDRKKDRTRPNFRQLHLIESELADELAGRGFSVRPCDLGENITTRGLNLTSFPEGALFLIGESAVIRLTGLRAACIKINKFHKGLQSAVTEQSHGAKTVKRAVMAIVVTGGRIYQDDPIRVIVPSGPSGPLKPVYPATFPQPSQACRRRPRLPSGPPEQGRKSHAKRNSRLPGAFV